LELVRNFHFDAGTAGNERSLFDEGSHDTEGIMEGTVSLVEDELVRASEQKRDCLALVGASGNLDDFDSTLADFLNEVGMSELFGSELVNMGYWGSINSPGDEVDLGTFDILNHHDALLGQEMECEVAHCLAENAFLEEDNVNTGLHNLLNEIDNVLALFFEQSIDRGVVADANVRVHIGLGG